MPEQDLYRSLTDAYASIYNEDYESTKKKEVLSALNKKKGDFTKRYGKDGPDVMHAVASKTAKDKGDTSKSDDRYAYEHTNWLGQNGLSKESMASLGDAYKSMYENLDQAKKNVGADSCWDGYKAKGTKTKGGKDVPNCVKEEESLPEEYRVSEENHVAIMEGKKKCKEGYKYDSDKKKCVKKDKKSRSNTTIIVGRGYGYGGHHDHDDDKEPDSNGGDGGGDGGGGGGGDGGGGGE